MPSSAAIFARDIEARDSHLVITTHRGKTEVRWEKLSEKLAQATTAERQRCTLSPSGYAVRWPLLDEDLAIGPIVAPPR